MERKDFFKFVVASAATGSLIAFVESCKKSADTTPQGSTADFTVDLTQAANSALLTSGGSLILNNIIIINNNGNYAALYDVCTHQSCALAYDNTSPRLVCPCHGSQFSLVGAVINGPATVSIKAYTVAKNGNILHITG